MMLHQRGGEEHLHWLYFRPILLYIIQAGGFGAFCLFLFIEPINTLCYIRPSTRNRAKIKLALQGCAGSGKTYSALLLAYGMTSDWSKIAVIDSENGSADLYAHLGAYNVVSLGGDYSPENYIEAITLCENAGMEVIIVDSISQCWDYLLDFHAGLQGNSFANWAKVTPRQNAFAQKILQSEVHIICTIRTKQDYVLNEKNSKMVPEKVGLKAMQRMAWTMNLPSSWT